jgi:hypothetical protein
MVCAAFFFQKMFTQQGSPNKERSLQRPLTRTVRPFILSGAFLAVTLVAALGATAPAETIGSAQLVQASA